MKLKKVFVVMSTTGEYSDRSEWPIKGFTKQDKAQAEQDRLIRAAVELGMHTSQGGGTIPWEKRVAINKTMQSFGARSIDYTGIDFYLMEVDMG